MDISARFLEAKEFAAAGLFEEPERSLFYRKALGIRRYWENYPLQPYEGKPLYPSGPIDRSKTIAWDFMAGFPSMAPTVTSWTQNFWNSTGRIFAVTNPSYPLNIP